MNRKEAIAWVLSACSQCLRLSQAKTLSKVVEGALSTPRLSLAEVGRRMTGKTAAKYRIKRAWRFIDNDRVEPLQVMPALMGRLLRRWLKRRKKRPVVISLDWTDVRSFHTLMAAVVIKGRAIPLGWASYGDKVQGKSQNALEESLLLAIKAALPPDVRVVILADRGFGRTELGRFCQKIGFDYIIRIKAKVKVQIGSQTTRLDQYPVKRGMRRKLKNVLYRSDHDPLTQHVVVRWKKGLTGDKDQPWYLMTNLDQPAIQISDLYARRFDIEEFFRDAKGRRLGWGLRDCRVTTADRLDRLLLVLALAYLLLTALGLWAKTHLSPKRWCSNTRENECSAFTVGRLMFGQIKRKLEVLLQTLEKAVMEAGGKWG